MMKIVSFHALAIAQTIMKPHVYFIEAIKYDTLGNSDDTMGHESQLYK